MNKIITFIAVMVMSVGSFAKVDLATLPQADATEITIYNSGDITLVRDSRSLTLKEGTNELQFSWANTLIDPTSLEMLPKAHAESIQVNELSFPPRVTNLGLWKIESEIGGKVPMEIRYMTSGLSWRAFYMGTLSEDEKTMHLQGYVVVTNNSGEDYNNAQTRLIVGKVHLLDQIADLARRQQPYLSNIPTTSESSRVVRNPVPFFAINGSVMGSAGGVMGGMGGGVIVTNGDSNFDFYYAGAPKDVVKEGLSEYFLYSIDGTETISNGWSKRLASFEADDVPVVNLYKYEQERYGNSVVRFLSFKNDTEHKLGETPIPDGNMQLFRTVDDMQHLSYEGQSSFKYIPVNEKAELDLGGVSDVVVEAKLMKEKTDNFRFDNDGNINGWDEIKEFQIEVGNTRDLAVKVELKRNFPTQYWELQNSGDCGKYEKEDFDTVKYTLTLEPQSKKTFSYTLHTYVGTRQENWRP